MNKFPTRLQFTADLIADLLAATPEGFFNRAELDAQRLGSGSRSKAVAQAIEEGRVGRVGNFLYDPTRLTPEQVIARSLMYPGSVPNLNPADHSITVPPVAQRQQERADLLNNLADPVLDQMLARFTDSVGFLPMSTLVVTPEDETTLNTLLGVGALRKAGELIFDPLMMTRSSISVVQKRETLAPVRREIIDLLSRQPGFTIPRVDLIEKYGSKTLQAVIDTGGLVAYTIPVPLGEATWIRLEEADEEEARNVAIEATRPKDEDWQTALDYSGDMLRHGVKEGGSTRREQVLARSYPVTHAAARLELYKETVQEAINSRQIIAFMDPEGQQRIPAYEIEDILSNPDLHESIAELEVVRMRDLQIALGEPREQSIRQRLRRLRGGTSANKYRWGQIKDILFGEEFTQREFRALLHERKHSWDEQYDERQRESRRQREAAREEERAQRAAERHQREELRARLLAAFPAWQHAGRADQRIIFHVGPPNSGKTHNALDRLAEVNSGWYLAPLRLLAFEVFERLNKRGVRCNLLTGEEYIPVDGALVTAATIEMFNPHQSGECVVIDEAQMLADPDRGWAWTRALMEAESPEIYVIGPQHSGDLIQRLAAAAAIPVEVVEHQRLAPIKLAERPWSLERMPPRTILVAFSRSMVLRLKSALEQYGRRVSVVYGNLPPEVRRKQADRFAEGETEICVATDAVGMGLNLPADQVCFYEMSKFDGKDNRLLTPSEVHQIGGRAGRFGLSTAGEVGAINRRELRTLNGLYAMPPEELTHARVAPTVEDLTLLPGSLARRFAQWRELQSIPETLRDVIKPADIDERIALAQLLTDQEVEQLGLATAVQLVNAPTRESSRSYWLFCARAILSDTDMPLPPPAPNIIDDSSDLDRTEDSITCADIYLWLSNRKEFAGFGGEQEKVREMRLAWSMSIDAALLRRVDTAARCISCHRKLPLNHRFSLCDDCYHQRWSYRY
ncbi:MAG: hypothetical protein KF726_25585 [Anaerolineae bacterium]|nr:hypothetical protein [Anaerolineae bacterium]